MAWESCVLLLNSDSTSSFYSGDIVTGSVILEFKEEQKIKYIDFQVTGVAKAQWSRSMPTMPFIRIYSEKNTILDYSIDVFSELEGKTVKPGIHSYHFHFVLPHGIPSTFENSVAKVNYYVKIVGKSECKFKRKKIVPFVVQGSLNLNHIPDYLEPVYVEWQKVFWNSSKFSIRCKTFKGFAPKQHIPFEIVVTNENKVKIAKMYVYLVQKLRYTVSSGYADDEKKLHKICYNKFSNTVTETCNFDIEIPQIVPSSIILIEPMIDISYAFRMEFLFSFHTALSKDIPVTVATIPVLHQDFNETNKSTYSY